jgi:multiple antibiotic resistance protein
MTPVQGAIALSLKDVFTFFFIMLGPLRLIGPFAKLTAGRPEGELRQVALQGSGIATLTVLVAGLIGSSMLVKWHVVVGALAIAGGILFFVVALRMVLSPYTEEAKPAAGPAPAPVPAAALVRLLVPDIVSPWGICAVIFVLTLMPAQTIPIMGILIGIMALDLLAMLFARQILRYLAFPLQLVGTVMGVLQVALSVQMVVLGIRLIAIERFGAHFPPL